MEFKFESNQQFQLQAIESIIKLFDGQHRTIGQLDLSGDGLGAIPNSLEVDSETILQNLRQVQIDNDLAPDENLRYVEEDISLSGKKTNVRFPNFSVEMETGTGKTYVYLRTILELFRRYGLRKFIIVVPSVAVREGVIKTLQMTKAHLQQLYENVPYRHYVYDSAKLSQVRHFAFSGNVEVMVMTIDSFNKASNLINQTTDHLQGETPIHLIQATRPILILDEPQNMVSELRVKALAALNPIFTLRYSATHRDPYNLVYCLTPFEAYRQGLVKQIEVAGAEQEDDVNQPFVRVNGIQSKKNTLIARLSVHKLMRGGTVKEQSIIAKPGDDLTEKTNRHEYNGYIVDEINLGTDFVRFTNGVELSIGESIGEDKKAIFETQIRYTIEEHFRKQRRFKSYGVKVLSLFFIDRVENYMADDGIIRSLFRRYFNELKWIYSEWEDVDVESVQAAYFAQRRTRSGETIYEDSKTGESERDREAYDLIMRDKERLLSFEEPTCFIFSHSALREGWDNPNVFQICTLNQTVSEMKKRQEIGRGVRLAVNQSGTRVFREGVNVLTVIANESYTRYVELLQTEIEEEYKGKVLPPPPANAHERGVSKLRKEYILKPEFQDLWERIKHKTRYAVVVDTNQLVKEVVETLDAAEIPPPRTAIAKARVHVGRDNIFSAIQMTGTNTAIDLSGRYPLPNMVDVMMHMLENTTPPMRLTRKTLIDIFMHTKKQQEALSNPYGFAVVAVRIIKEKLTDQLVNGIRYEKIGEFYEMCQFESSIESWEEYLIPARQCVYDRVIFESKNERDFVEGLNNRDDVKLYIKLPAFFTVPTPIGTYNPDWAIVKEARNEFGDPMKELYLVRETKSTTILDELRPDERRKVICGKRHFKDALGVDYDIVTSADEV